MTETRLQREFFGYLTLIDDFIDHGFPVIDHFYSDSLADTPLALCAEKAHMVTNHTRTVIDWPELDAETMKKVRKKTDTGWNSYVKED